MGEAGEGEGAGDEFAGGRVGGWRRLMGVEGTAVVFWRAELVAGVNGSVLEIGNCMNSYRRLGEL